MTTARRLPLGALLPPGSCNAATSAIEALLDLCGHNKIRIVSSLGGRARMKSSLMATSLVAMAVSSAVAADLFSVKAPPLFLSRRGQSGPDSMLD